MQCRKQHEAWWQNLLRGWQNGLVFNVGTLIQYKHIQGPCYQSQSLDCWLTAHHRKKSIQNKINTKLLPNSYRPLDGRGGLSPNTGLSRPPASCWWTDGRSVTSGADEPSNHSSTWLLWSTHVTAVESHWRPVTASQPAAKDSAIQHRWNEVGEKNE